MSNGGGASTPKEEPEAVMVAPTREPEAAMVAPTREEAEARVGQHCRIYWPVDKEWYDAKVRLYSAESGKHNVWYSIDEEVRT